MENFNLKLQDYQISYLKLRVDNLDQNNIKWNNLEAIPNVKDLYRLKNRDSYFNEFLQIYFSEEMDDATIKIQVPLFLSNKIDMEIDCIILFDLSEMIEEYIGISITSAKILQITSSAFLHFNDNERFRPFLKGHCRVSEWKTNIFLSVNDVSNKIDNSKTKYTLRYNFNYFRVNSIYDKKINFNDCLLGSNFIKALEEPFGSLMNFSFKTEI